MSEDFSDSFLEHAAVCSSQYDSTCRRMAAEILSLRRERNKQASDLASVRRTLRSLWVASTAGREPISTDVLALAGDVVVAIKNAPGQVRIRWDDRVTATVLEFGMTEIVAVDSKGGEIRFDPRDLFTGKLRFID